MTVPSADGLVLASGCWGPFWSAWFFSSSDGNAVEYQGTQRYRTGQTGDRVYGFSAGMSAGARVVDLDSDRHSFGIKNWQIGKFIGSYGYTAKGHQCQAACGRPMFVGDQEYVCS